MAPDHRVPADLVALRPEAFRDFDPQEAGPPADRTAGDRAGVDGSRAAAGRGMRAAAGGAERDSHIRTPRD